MSEWISVKDRLPKLCDYYLCFTIDNDIYKAEYLPSSKQWWVDGSDWLWDEVTHWMPLPEPPKGD